ncbi:hypothetical protein BTVI_43755 [Pitangus sulphuratus]|nr:hypothetical protein BTVI_43755 [Pitangus sulphuratus]
MGCQLFWEYAVGDSVKGFAEVQIVHNHSLPLIHQVGYLIIKGDQVTKTELEKVKSSYRELIKEVNSAKEKFKEAVVKGHVGPETISISLSAAVPDKFELQYELESKAGRWYTTIDIANAFFSIPLAAEYSPTICHRLIQAALEKDEVPEHQQYTDDIIGWGEAAEEVSKKGKKIIQILLGAGFAIKKSKVKGPAREIQFLGVKWKDGLHQIPIEVIDKITAMAPLTSKKETQAFLGAIGFWRMHILEYSQIVNPLYLVTHKKNDFQ